MARITAGTKIAVREDGDQLTLTADGEQVGRIRGTRVEVGELDVELVATGERRALDRGGRTRIVRLDPAGRKATWLTLSRHRSRLARQRPKPLFHQWVLTRDVEGERILTVTRTPLGTSLKVESTTDLTDQEVEALVGATLVEVLDIEPTEVSGARTG